MCTGGSTGRPSPHRLFLAANAFETLPRGGGHRGLIRVIMVSWFQSDKACMVTVQHWHLTLIDFMWDMMLILFLEGVLGCIVWGFKAHKHEVLSLKAAPPSTARSVIIRFFVPFLWIEWPDFMDILCTSLLKKKVFVFFCEEIVCEVFTIVKCSSEVQR